MIHLSESLSVKISEDELDYVKELGYGNITRGIQRIIREHQERSFQWDMESTLQFLSNYVTAIEFRQDK